MTTNNPNPDSPMGNLPPVHDPVSTPPPGSAGRQIADAANKVKTKLPDPDTIKQSIDEKLEPCVERIRKCPVASVFGALIVGVILGAAVSQSTRSRQHCTFRSWLEDTCSDIGDEVSDVYDHLPSKKQIQHQARALGNRLRFW